jgi:hypothetical protein
VQVLHMQAYGEVSLTKLEDKFQCIKWRNISKSFQIWNTDIVQYIDRSDYLRYRYCTVYGQIRLFEIQTLYSVWTDQTIWDTDIVQCMDRSDYLRYRYCTVYGQIRLFEIQILYSTLTDQTIWDTDIVQCMDRSDYLRYRYCTVYGQIRIFSIAMVPLVKSTVKSQNTHKFELNLFLVNFLNTKSRF